MRTRARRALSVALVAALLGAAGLTWFTMFQETPAAVLTDLDGRRVALDDTPDVAGSDLHHTGGRFQAPSQGLDVPLVEMSATGGVLNPPTLTDAFALRDPERTTPSGTRPRIVAMHAVRDGRAPGNAFFKSGAANPSVTVDEGDQLHVGGDTYVVVSTEVLPKEDAARSSGIWAPHPDGDERLVILTCLQRAGGTGPAPENLVVHAVRSR